MKVKVIKEIKSGDAVFAVGDMVEVDEKTFDKLMEGKFIEEVVELEIKSVEVVELPEVEEEVVEVKSIGTEVEGEVMAIEVKEEKRAPEQKLMDSLLVSKARATNIWTPQARAAEEKAIQGQGEAVAADGGALVDQEIVEGIWANAVEVGQVFPKASKRAVGMHKNSLEIKQLNEGSGTPADYNGVVLGVVAEGAVIAPQKLAYKNAQAPLNKLTAMIPFTSEILEDDAHQILQFTNTQVGKAFGMKLDDEVLYGTSSLLTAAVGAAGSVAVTLADSSAPTVAELIAMFAANIRPGNAEWFMSGAVYASLLNLEDSAGNPVLMPNYNVSPFGTLMGRPVNVVSAMLGANTENGTIGFCDFGDGYIVGTKGGIRQDSSIHLYFDTDQTAYRWALRVAGMPTKAATMTLKDGRTVAPLVFGADAT